MDDSVRHPIFARVYRLLSAFDESSMGVYRDELLAGLKGEVVEIGAGSGLNFGHLPPGVTSLIAVEPEPYLRRLATARAQQASVPVTVRSAVAERLPLGERSCDAVVACLVLCTVSSQLEALAEISRVLRPGGELRFLEHVTSDGRKGAAQRLLDGSGAWPLLAGGCRCARDTVASLKGAGFELINIRRLTIGPSWMPANPVVLGSALPPTRSARPSQAAETAGQRS
jgi:SAM-dependent methyltransferase